MLPEFFEQFLLGDVEIVHDDEVLVSPLEVTTFVLLFVLIDRATGFPFFGVVALEVGNLVPGDDGVLTENVIDFQFAVSNDNGRFTLDAEVDITLRLIPDQEQHAKQTNGFGYQQECFLKDRYIVRSDYYHTQNG